MPGYEVNAPDKTCPACDGLIPADAVVCTRCGLNFKTGTKVREADRDPADADRKARLLKQARKAGDLDTLTRLGAPPPGTVCSECGYDLTGLPGKPCPECGNERRIGAGRAKRREEQIRRYWIAAVLTAAIGGPVGIALTFAMGMGWRGWSVPQCLLHLALCEGGLCVGYFAMSFFFLGFEEDLRGLALRLVGVGTIWSALWVWSYSFGFGAPYGHVLLPAMIAATAVAVPLKWLTDRDWDDCYWIAFAAWVLAAVPHFFLLP